MSSKYQRKMKMHANWGHTLWETGASIGLKHSHRMVKRLMAALEDKQPDLYHSIGDLSRISRVMYTAKSIEAALMPFMIS